MPAIQHRQSHRIQTGTRLPRPEVATPPGIAFTADQHARLADWCQVWGVRREIELGHDECEEVIWIYAQDAAHSDLALYRDGDKGDVVALLGGAELAWGSLADVLACLSCMPPGMPEEPAAG